MERSENGPTSNRKVTVGPFDGGVPRLLELLELGIARRGWRRRPHESHLLMPLGKLCLLFGGQDSGNLRHHLRVLHFHLDLNFRARFSRRSKRGFVEVSAQWIRQIGRASCRERG